jgi:hypothetical protein
MSANISRMVEPFLTKENMKPCLGLDMPGPRTGLFTSFLNDQQK